MPEPQPDPDTSAAPARPDAAAAAALQGKLRCASQDLDRLQQLLSDATQTLLQHFCGASLRINQLAQRGSDHSVAPNSAALHEVMHQLGGAVTALQFQDMASQLIVHTKLQLRHCLRDLGGDGANDATDDTPTAMPANPVTQDRMHAGSVELF